MPFSFLAPAYFWGRRGRIVVEFTTTYAVSPYHHQRFEFESCSGEVNSMYNIM